MTRNRLAIMMAATTLGVVAVVWPRADAPLVVWNASRSVPVGLYTIIARAPMRVELAVLQLPEPVRRFADARGYLPATALLIKPVVAGDGNIVCRHGPIVTIDGRPVARARTLDDAGHALPRWSGCRRLDAARIFVLSAQNGSFDSRYFGPVDARQIRGTAVPLWTR